MTTYEFEIPVSLVPERDTFQIGDTITINSSFPNMVYDRATMQEYHLDSFLFYPKSYIRKIDSTVATHNLSEFEVLIPEGQDFRVFTYSDGGKSVLGQYNYENKIYSLTFSLVLRKKGLYRFSLSSFLYPRGQDQDFEGRCPKRLAGLDAYCKLNDGGDNNIEYMLESPDSSIHVFVNRESKRYQFHKFAGYCFYVKE